MSKQAEERLAQISQQQGRILKRIEEISTAINECLPFSTHEIDTIATAVVRKLMETEEKTNRKTKMTLEHLLDMVNKDIGQSSSRAVARKMGIDHAGLHRMLKRETNPSWETLCKIAVHYNIESIIVNEG